VLCSKLAGIQVLIKIAGIFELICNVSFFETADYWVLP